MSFRAYLCRFGHTCVVSRILVSFRAYLCRFGHAFVVSRGLNENKPRRTLPA